VRKIKHVKILGLSVFAIGSFVELNSVLEASVAIVPAEEAQLQHLNIANQICTPEIPAEFLKKCKLLATALASRGNELLEKYAKGKNILLTQYTDNGGQLKTIMIVPSFITQEDRTTLCKMYGIEILDFGNENVQQCVLKHADDDVFKKMFPAAVDKLIKVATDSANKTQLKRSADKVKHILAAASNYLQRDLQLPKEQASAIRKAVENKYNADHAEYSSSKSKEKQQTITCDCLSQTDKQSLCKTCILKVWTNEEIIKVADDAFRETTLESIPLYTIWRSKLQAQGGTAAPYLFMPEDMSPSDNVALLTNKEIEENGLVVLSGKQRDERLRIQAKGCVDGVGSPEKDKKQEYASIPRYANEGIDYVGLPENGQWTLYDVDLLDSRHMYSRSHPKILRIRIPSLGTGIEERVAQEKMYREEYELDARGHPLVHSRSGKNSKKYSWKGSPYYSSSHTPTNANRSRDTFNERVVDDSGHAITLSDPRLVPFGLINVGNTCYFNSVMQALYASPFFRKKVREISTEGTVGHVLKGLFDRMNSANSIDSASVRECIKNIAQEFAKNSRCQPHEMMAWEQCDAADLLDGVLNEVFLKHQDIRESFSSLTKTITCRINHTAKVSDSNTVLGVSINNDNIKNCVDGLQVEEEIDSWDCDTCGDKVQATSSQTIQEKDILILHLYRFEYDKTCKCSHKVYKKVDYDESLDVNGTVYNLKAIVKHYGSLCSGHYVATVRGADDKWYTQNDEQTRCHASFDASKSQDVSFTPYIFVYERSSQTAEKSESEEN
jgi:hypothetical protein